MLLSVNSSPSDTTTMSQSNPESIIFTVHDCVQLVSFRFVLFHCRSRRLEQHAINSSSRLARSRVLSFSDRGVSVHRWFEGGVTFAPPPPTTFRTVSLSKILLVGKE